MPVLLSLEAVSKSYRTGLLFDGISLEIGDDERLGMIGPNGAGKSTLLKLMAGSEEPDVGKVTVRRGGRIAYLAQQDAFDAAATVAQAMHAALADDHDPPHKQSARIAATLSRVGFESDEQVVGKLSGGWRKRLALAAELVREPDLLLLDEPTNHLDLEGILWLEKLLTNPSFAFVLVTHDRVLLENVARRVVEVNRTYPQGYLRVEGRYSDFLQRREDLLATQAREQATLANKVRREIEWLRRGPKARTTKAEYRIRQAGELKGELAAVAARNEHGRKVEIDFTSSQRKANKLLTAEGLSKSLGGRRLFGGVSFLLSPGMRLGLLGPNGSGKTTLLRLLTGELPPDEGEIKRASGLRTIWFDQNRRQLDPQAKLRDALSPNGDAVMFQGRQTHVVAWARRFLFRAEQLEQPVERLSGGEQARILIANLMLQEADLLLLDEPTNDLDIATLEILEDSLTEFAGAIVLITHDRYLLDRVSTEVLALDGEGESGIYADYSQWQEAQREKSAAVVEAEKKTAAKKPETAKSEAGGAKRLSYKEQQELAKMEDTIFAAEASAAELEEQIQQLATTSDYVALQQRSEQLHAAQAEVKRLYARWEELEQRK